MSLRRVDPRFCLPERAGTAIVSAASRLVAGRIAEAGVEVRSAGPADLAVAARSAGAKRWQPEPGRSILEGRGGTDGCSRAPACIPRQFSCVLDWTAPRRYCPLDERKPAAYAISNWSAGHDALQACSEQARGRHAARGRCCRRWSRWSQSARRDGWRPAAIPRAGRSVHSAFPADAGWFMTCGLGDALSRNVFQRLLARGRRPHLGAEVLPPGGMRRSVSARRGGACTGRRVRFPSSRLTRRRCSAGSRWTASRRHSRRLRRGKRLRALLLAPGSGPREAADHRRHRRVAARRRARDRRRAVRAR